jgi:5-methylcytosine-specific restriction endonuclease McrA
MGMASELDSIVQALLKQKPDFRIGLWEREECYRFYVKQRRRNCTFTELMNLWFLAPRCVSCKENDPLFWGTPPDITPMNWKEDLEGKVGEKRLKATVKQLRANADYAFLCQRCGRELRPWDDDDMYVEHIHMEEHYSIPMETPGKKQPSMWIQNRIFELYDFKCFGCGKKKKHLHIDHVMPRSHGGDAAFRNLQALCTPCGQKKGNALPTEVSVYIDMYFNPCPSDAYEGLFW